MSRYFMFFIAVFLVPLVVEATKPVEFVVVITSYNNGSSNENRCLKNLRSVCQQTYPHFTVAYVDDCSTDDTRKLVDAYVAEYGMQDKFTVIHNTQRLGKMENQYKVINQLDPHKVIIDLDGDDELAHNRVLEKLAAIYADGNVWLTWGSFKDTNGMMGGCSPFPPEVIQTKKFRSCGLWITSHLKTYYAKLFQLIQKEDLQFKGIFFQMATDQAIMFPMIEMASNNHFKFVKEILYIYCISNPLNCFRKNIQLQMQMAEEVRSKTPYAPLTKLF